MIHFIVVYGFQMATSAVLVPLSKLMDNEDNEILDRIIKLAFDFLPEGWQQWSISSEYASDIDLKLDAQTLNKLKFALPTVGLVRAFYPDARSISEKAFRRMKDELLRWPFCRGLIIGPPELSRKIRASHMQHELIIQSVAHLKPLMISRTEASLQINQEASDEDENYEKENLIPRKRKHSSTESRPDNTRLIQLETRQERIESLLEELVHQRQRQTATEEPDGESDSSVSSDQSMAEEEWNAPNFALNSSMDLISFDPQTKEQEPAIPDPLPELAEQAIKCQRLGEQGWNKIRYMEAQKKLHASGVFSPLKTNLQMNCTVSRSTCENLEKIEGVYGILTHGLLLQRKYFQEAIKILVTKHPTISEEIKILFTDTSSSFKTTSDDLLQYVCGKRAEVIEARRKCFLPKNGIIEQTVRKIPPSKTHIFDQDQIKEINFQNHGQTSSYRRFHSKENRKFNFDKPRKTFKSTTRHKSSSFTRNRDDKKIYKSSNKTDRTSNENRKIKRSF